MGIAHTENITGGKEEPNVLEAWQFANDEPLHNQIGIFWL